MTAEGKFKPHILSRNVYVAFDFLHSGKVTINRDPIVVATVWDFLLDVLCLRVHDFYSPCPYGLYIGYMCSVFGF